MQVLDADYEYAGFHYTILKNGLLTNASPHSGQHPAAGKAKHIRAAIDCYLQDERNRAKKVTI